MTKEDILAALAQPPAWLEVPTSEIVSIFSIDPIAAQFRSSGLTHPARPHPVKVWMDSDEVLEALQSQPGPKLYLWLNFAEGADTYLFYRGPQTQESTARILAHEKVLSTFRPGIKLTS